MNASLTEIREWRGVKGLVAAKVLTDDNGTDGYTTGDVYAVAGVATISRTTDSSSEAHYYDDMPAVVISGFGADTVTIDTSALPMDVLAWITGQTYDSNLGMMIEGNPEAADYFAIGYITEKENGDEVYVWRYKGRFTIPDQTNNTMDNTTNANGNQLVYTGIKTTHKFTNGDDGAKAIAVDVGLGLADVSAFFDTVTTPDDLQAVTP